MCVIYALLGLIIFTAVVFCIPFDIVFYLNTSDLKSRSLQFRWLFGLVRFKSGRKVEKEKIKAEKKGEKRGGKKFKPELIFEILRIRGLIRRAARFLAGIIRSFRIKKLSVDLTFGSEDPVHSGYLFAISAPLNYFLKKNSCTISINPVFEGQYIFDLIAEGTVRIYPVQILLNTLSFIFSVPFIKVIWILLIKWK